MKKKATIVSVIIGILAVAAIIVFSAYRSSESIEKQRGSNTVGLLCDLYRRINFC